MGERGQKGWILAQKATTHVNLLTKGCCQNLQKEKNQAKLLYTVYKISFDRSAGHKHHRHICVCVCLWKARNFCHPMLHQLDLWAQPSYCHTVCEVLRHCLFFFSRMELGRKWVRFGTDEPRSVVISDWWRLVDSKGKMQGESKTIIVDKNNPLLKSKTSGVDRSFVRGSLKAVSTNDRACVCVCMGKWHVFALVFVDCTLF